MTLRGRGRQSGPYDANFSMNYEPAFGLELVYLPLSAIRYDNDLRATPL